MPRTARTLPILLAAALAAGCASTGSGPAPRSSLAGPDADGDGVRDDVQRWIPSTYPASRRLQAALLEQARSFQAWLAVPPGDAGAAHAAAERSSRAMECVYAVAGADRAYAAIDVLKARVFDTDARQLRQEATDALLHGTVFETTPGYERGITCTFDPAALPD